MLYTQSQIRCIELCCEKCKEEGKQVECVHMLHLVPVWQSEERHRKLKIMMQDRPDLIQSELAGLAFDSLQQVFRKCDIRMAMDLEPLPLPQYPTIFTVIDPAAGGPQSDYAIVSITRNRGNITVSYAIAHSSCALATKELGVMLSLQKNGRTASLRRSRKKRVSLACMCSCSDTMMSCFSCWSTFSSRKKRVRHRV